MVALKGSVHPKTYSLFPLVASVKSNSLSFYMSKFGDFCQSALFMADPINQIRTKQRLLLVFKIVGHTGEN